MSHSLNSFLNTAIHKASDVAKNAPVLKSLCYTFIDEVAPGLGKKQKAKLASDCTDKISQYAKAGKKVTIKSLRRIIPEVVENNIDFDVIKSLPYGPSSVKTKTSSNDMGRASGNSQTQKGGGVPIGGTTTYAPVSISRNISRKSKPRMSTRGDGVVISHSELLGSVLTGAPTSNVTAYRATGFRANPGISSIFPWLSSVAVNYEKYRFRRIRFTLVPLVSTAYNGRIGIGFDFDSSDGNPGNRQEFYALSNHAESMPWQPCGISVKTDNTFRFTGTHVASDNKLIDLGQVIVMSDSISNGLTLSAAFPIFDIIVDYEVELIEPQQALFATQTFSNTVPLINNVPLGLGVDTTSITGPQIVTGTTVLTGSVSFSLPPGTYAFMMRCGWSANTATTTVGAPTAGSALKSNTAAGASFAMSTGVITSSTDCSLLLSVGTVNFATNLTAFNVMISRVPLAVFNNYINA